MFAKHSVMVASSTLLVVLFGLVISSSLVVFAGQVGGGDSNLTSTVISTETADSAQGNNGTNTTLALTAATSSGGMADTSMQAETITTTPTKNNTLMYSGSSMTINLTVTFSGGQLPDTSTPDDINRLQVAAVDGLGGSDGSANQPNSSSTKMPSQLGVTFPNMDDIQNAISKGMNQIATGLPNLIPPAIANDAKCLEAWTKANVKCIQKVAEKVKKMKSDEKTPPDEIVCSYAYEMSFCVIEQVCSCNYTLIHDLEIGEKKELEKEFSQCKDYFKGYKYMAADKFKCTKSNLVIIIVIVVIVLVCCCSICGGICYLKGKSGGGGGSAGARKPPSKPPSKFSGAKSVY